MKYNSIIIMKATKRNATVVMERNNYPKNIYELQDNKAHKEIQKNPSEKITKAAKKLTKRSIIPEESEERRIFPRVNIMELVKV